MGVITLLTDFGTRDEYVGVMKGVILCVNPAASVVDISHRIAPYDVRSAGYMLQSAYAYFPAGTVHTVVVDPGVGGSRSVIAFSADRHVFLGPDNGVFSQILSNLEPDEIVRVDNSEYFLSPLSHTFHGRDIFAPVAAGLSRGLELSSLGPTIRRQQLVRLTVPQPKFTDDGGFVGEVVSIDRFGNLVTNIGAVDIARFSSGEEERTPLFLFSDCRIHGLSTSYDNAVGLAPLAIIGSHGAVEIAIAKASARQALNARVGDTVRVVWVQADGLQVDER